jgi:hypothetical protein
MQRTEKVIEIDAPVERVFDLFSDFESFPRWMRNIKEVRYTGRRYTRWKADAPFGSSVEWEAETTSFEPDRRIAWRSVRGDVYTEGEVDFEETRRGTTLLRVVLGYDPPAGRLGSLVAHLFGMDPEQQLEEDLDRFAEVVEAGRRRRRKKRDGYGVREGAARGGHAPPPPRDERRRGGSREEFARRDAREDDYARRTRDERDVEHWPRDYDDDADERRRERAASRQRFQEALGEARRSQLESRRRYREWQDERRREHDERQRERRMDEPEEDRRFEDERRRRPSYRYPMTPREWEHDRENREPDYEYSRKVLRRGVDRLMDEPPSRRWRRWD